MELWWFSHPSVLCQSRKMKNALRENAFVFLLLCFWEKIIKNNQKVKDC